MPDRAYGRAPDGALRPALAVAYTRVTLAAPGERVTCDFDLTFNGAGGATAGSTRRWRSSRASRTAATPSPTALLRELGHRPQPLCSKYCLGVALTRPVTANPLRPLLRHFA